MMKNEPFPREYKQPLVYPENAFIPHKFNFKGPLKRPFITPKRKASMLDTHMCGSRSVPSWLWCALCARNVQVKQLDSAVYLQRLRGELHIFYMWRIRTWKSVAWILRLQYHTHIGISGVYVIGRWKIVLCLGIKLFRMFSGIEWREEEGLNSKK